MGRGQGITVIGRLPGDSKVSPAEKPGLVRRGSKRTPEDSGGRQRPLSALCCLLTVSTGVGYLTSRKQSFLPGAVGSLTATGQGCREAYLR